MYDFKCFSIAPTKILLLVVVVASWYILMSNKNGLSTLIGWEKQGERWYSQLPEGRPWLIAAWV